MSIREEFREFSEYMAKSGRMTTFYATHAVVIALPVISAGIASATFVEAAIDPRPEILFVAAFASMGTILTTGMSRLMVGVGAQLHRSHLIDNPLPRG